MGKEELFGGSRGAEGEKENLERVFLADFNWGREDVRGEREGRKGGGIAANLGQGPTASSSRERRKENIQRKSEPHFSPFISLRSVCPFKHSFKKFPLS